MKEKHFVIFFSPGTFVAEQTRQPIKSWSVPTAIKMSRDIKERHCATPYGFCFTTRARNDNELDSKEVKRSCMYYLGGEVMTLEQVEKRNDPKDRILISNMRGNGYEKIIINTNSWKWTQPLEEGDVVLEY